MPLRLPRAAAITVAMLSLSAGAHLLAGGTLPAPLIMAGLTVLTLLPVMLISRARIAGPVMAVMLGLSQLVLHEAFVRFSAASAFSPAPVGHVHDLAALAQVPAVLAGGASAADPGTLMLVLHAVATALTALMLAKGEAALWALSAWLRPLVRLLVAALVPASPTLEPFFIAFLPRRWRSLRLPALRGPPAAAL